MHPSPRPPSRFIREALPLAALFDGVQLIVPRANGMRAYPYFEPHHVEKHIRCGSEYATSPGAVRGW